MRENWDVVVASPCMEDRTALLHILDALSLNVLSCSGLEQVQEVLSRHRVPLVFCDERLTGGSCRDLLSSQDGQKPRVVVTIHSSEWDDSPNAIRRGVFDAIRFPLQPTDVELVVLRAMRGKQISPGEGTA
jgi:DNA-binding NtrC family response regulator